MLSRPPETQFYENDANAQLWRDLSRLYEDFAGESGSGSRQDKRFLHVLGDLENLLDPMPCPTCRSTTVINVAVEGVKLQCQRCQWAIGVAGQEATTTRCPNDNAIMDEGISRYRRCPVCHYQEGG